MGMFLIAGSFRITGAQPDGDSIRFTPDDPAKWDLITGNQVKRNASGAAQLRLDAIDALETHYGTPRTHQPLDLAHAGAAELLDWLGFSNVVRGQDETVTSSRPDTTSGFILTRSADLYLRCIAFVGRGAPPQDDGSSFFVDVDALRTTYNHHLIKQGLAYPTYYRALFPDLRDEFTAVARHARDAGLGVWACLQAAKQHPADRRRGGTPTPPVLAHRDIGTARLGCDFAGREEAGRERSRRRA